MTRRGFEVLRSGAVPSAVPSTDRGSAAARRSWEEASELLAEQRTDYAAIRRERAEREARRRKGREQAND